MQYLIRFVCFSALMLSLVQAQTLEQLEDAYQKSLARLESEQEEEFNELGVKYLMALDREKETQQQQGELDVFLELQQEWTRFFETKRTPQKDQVSRHPSLHGLQQRLIEAASKIDAAYDMRIRMLQLKYLERIDAEISSLTRQGKIDEAVELREKRTSMGANLPKAPVPVAPPPVSVSSPPAETEGGDVVFDGHRYRLIQKSLPWQEAKEEAEALGGRLVVIESLKEHQVVVELASGLRCWIGASSGGGGKMKWVSGEDVERIKGVSVSSGAGKKTMGFTIDPGGRWNDYEATGGTRIKGYIVEWVR